MCPDSIHTLHDIYGCLYICEIRGQDRQIRVGGETTEMMDLASHLASIFMRLRRYPVKRLKVASFQQEYQEIDNLKNLLKTEKIRKRTNNFDESNFRILLQILTQNSFHFKIFKKLP